MPMKKDDAGVKYRSVIFFYFVCLEKSDRMAGGW